PGKLSLLTLKQVLDWLPISERTIHRYLDAGKLRAYKMDGLLLFNPTDIENFLKRRSVGGGPLTPFKDQPELNASQYKPMSDAEAQEFFKNCERDQDGNLIAKLDEELETP